MEINLSPSWRKVLENEFNSAYFKFLENEIDHKRKAQPDAVFPPEMDVFKAFNFCEPKDVKVVILGQDPYPTKGHANGLCFSINPTVRPFAKSLTNIFKEITSDVNAPWPSNGDLTRWANQGVLLLNSILTVDEGKPLSHINLGWEKFTDAVIKLLVEKHSGIVFMLWGSTAQSKFVGVNTSNHLILTAVHPSPLSAYRGFFGCKHFSKANDYLLNQNKSTIQW